MRRTSVLWMGIMLAAALAAASCDAPRSPVGPSAGPHLALEEGTGGVAARPGERSITVCHVTGSGEYQRLTIASAAESAHRGHGDGVPGQAVPGREGMVFDENCEAVARSIVLTEGSWVANFHRYDPLVLFTVQGEDLLASGRWATAEALSFCRPCVPGEVFSVRAVFDNQTPTTIASAASGTATLGAIAYPFLEFGGPLTFEGGTVVIPGPPAEPGVTQLVTATTPFTLSGRLKGYEVLGRREPLLVFDVPVTGRGTVTIEWLGHGGHQTLELYRLGFEFADMR